MSFLTDLPSVLLKSAPLLATAVASPAAGMAVSLLESVFGLSNSKPAELIAKISADPDRELKLKQLEAQHGENLITLANAKYALEAQDRSSAREREIQLHDHTPAILAYILTVGVFCALAYLFIMPVPQDNKELIVAIISSMTTVWVAAMAYYHGSSLGSRNKENMLSKK